MRGIGPSLVVSQRPSYLNGVVCVMDVHLIIVDRVPLVVVGGGGDIDFQVKDNTCLAVAQKAATYYISIRAVADIFHLRLRLSPEYFECVCGRAWNFDGGVCVIQCNMLSFGFVELDSHVQEAPLTIAESAR